MDFSVLELTGDRLASREDIPLQEARSRLADIRRLREAYLAIGAHSVEGLAEWLDVLSDDLRCWVEGRATMPTGRRQSLGQKLRFLDPEQRRRQQLARRLDLEELDRAARAEDISISRQELDRRIEHVKLLRRVQDKKGWTQEELADALDVSAGAVRNWMQLIRSVPGPVLKLAQIWLDE